MPTATDLVTDLPADFAVFGQAVDTSMAGLLGGTTGQVLSKTSGTNMAFTWITPELGDITAVNAGTGISGGGTTGAVTVTNSMATAMTTSGDLIQATGSGTFARLGTGTSGQYLTTNGTTNSWASVSTSQNWSLVNAGGTALTGATTITVSGISGANQIFVLFTAASSASASSQISLRLNGDTAGNYYWLGGAFVRRATYDPTLWDSNPLQSAATLIPLGIMNSNATNYVSGSALITGANSSGLKVITANGTVNTDGSGGTNYFNSGYYNSSSTISSVSIVSGTGNFDNGTIYIYKTA